MLFPLYLFVVTSKKLEPLFQKILPGSEFPSRLFDFLLCGPNNKSRLQWKILSCSWSRFLCSTFLITYNKNNQHFCEYKNLGKILPYESHFNRIFKLVKSFFFLISLDMIFFFSFVNLFLLSLATFLNNNNSFFIVIFHTYLKKVFCCFKM